MNKKLAISSSNSETSGTGRHSMFESAVTPFFGSMRKQKFESLKKQSSIDTNRGNQQNLNTQEFIQRVVEQNQGKFIDDDGIGDFRLGFSFADEFQSQNDNNFSFDPSLIGQPFSFMNNFASQSTNFFQSNASVDPLFKSGISSYTNPDNLNRQSESGFATITTNEKKPSFPDFFSFPIDPSQRPIETFMNEQLKKPCFGKQYGGQSKDIIYEVESKFECEGQTNFLDNMSQSRNLSHQKVSNSQQVSEQIEKKASEYEMLRQSIIKEISQMDSDQWEGRQQDFEEIKKQSSSKSNKQSNSKKVMSEAQPQQKKNNFNQSIINKLFTESQKQEQDYGGHYENQMKASKNMMAFSVRNNQQQQRQITSHMNKKIDAKNEHTTSPNERFKRKSSHQKHQQQKNNDNIYESQVEQMTNERLDMIKKSSKAITRKNQINSIQKSKDNFSVDQKSVSNQDNLNNTNHVRKNLNFFLRKNNQNLDSQKHQQLIQKPNITKTTNSPITFPKPQENTQTEENQNKRKRPIFNFRLRNRFSFKNEVIDERQEFQNEQKPQVVRREYFSETLQIQNDLDSKPIEMCQSSAKQNDYESLIHNKKTDNDDFKKTTKQFQKSVRFNDKSFTKRQIPQKQNNQDHQNEIMEIQNKGYQGREKRLNTFNLKRRIPKDTVVNDQKDQPKQNIPDNNNNQTSSSSDNTIKPQQKLPIKRFELNFNRKYKRENNEKSLQRLQKVSQTSSKHSLSSDGIKIDTKGFMEKVLSNNEFGNNNKNQTNLNKEKRNPILNFKRLNRFQSLFGKDNAKEKQKERQKQEEKQQISTKQLIQNDSESNALKNDKFSTHQLSGHKIASTNQYRSEQKKQRLSQNQITYKSYQRNQQDSELSLQEERRNPFISKYIFSKRTPPKQLVKDNVQSKSKSVTFDTVKRVESNDIDDLEEDNLSFNSVPYQRIPTDNSKVTQVKRRQNNLMKGIGNRSREQYSSLNNGQLQVQRLNLHSKSSSIPTISSRSRKSAEMMKQILEVIEQAQNLKQKLLRVKRQREQQYRRITFLNRIAKEKFSDQRIKQMMDWGEMEDELDNSWDTERRNQQRRTAR